MFELIAPSPWYWRWSRRAFLACTPIAFLAYLVRPRNYVIFGSLDPFNLSNHAPPSFPQFFSEILGCYHGTAAAAALAVVCAVACRRIRHATRRPVPGLVWYLPAFVAAVEATRHITLLGSRHSYTHMQSIAELRETFLIAAASSLSTLAVCLALGWACARLARDRSRLPLATLPLFLSVAGCWSGVIFIVLLGPW